MKESAETLFSNSYGNCYCNVATWLPGGFAEDRRQLPPVKLTELQDLLFCLFILEKCIGVVLLLYSNKYYSDFIYLNIF